MQVSAQQVKELRGRTSAGFMDCKKALTACDGNLEAAMDWLRTKGLADAAKKADRVAAEGLVASAVRGREGAVVEINAETDFAARSEAFQALARAVVQVALDVGPDVKAIGEAPFPGGGTVDERIREAVTSIGENLSLRRAAAFSVGAGCVASYTHNAVSPGLGRIGVLVAVESEAGDAAAVEAMGRQLAMHVAAMRPLAISEDALDPALLARERELLAAQAAEAESGKPPHIVERIVDGRLRKFVRENCLLDQSFVIDADLTVRKALEQAAGTLGTPLEVAGFQRFAVGEGVERRQDDFAEEVAKVAGG